MTRPLLSALALAAVATLTLVATPGAPVGAAAADPAVAPATTTSADGRTSTDGRRTLTTSLAAGLEPSGQQVAVAGSGYDATKGIYVALCAIPPRNALPSPCGGGVDIEGQAGAAQWISSNPPDYGIGLAQPYGPSGSFSTRFTVRAEIAPGIDCRQVRCAIVTRSDHTRTSDRSQDIFIPVSFQAEPTAPPATLAPGGTGQVPTTTTPPPSSTPTVEVPQTIAPEAPPSSAPKATVSEDGSEVTDGTRSLTVSDVADLDPERASVTVAGSGFDQGSGVYLALCAIPSDPTTAPSPCSAGGTTSAWISSNPPEAGADLATPYDEGGSFEVELQLAAVIDAQTDCRTTPCAVTVRFDDQRPDDRTGDLALPVTFADEAAPETTTTAVAAIDQGGEPGAAEATVAIADAPSDAPRTRAPYAIVAALAAAALGAGLWLRARRAAADGVVP
jgi:hypothetical protein